MLALFLTFCYGVTTITFSIGLDKLWDHVERMWLIQFIVWFPVLVLLCFMAISFFKPEVFYAPSDFKDESNFMRLFDDSRSMTKEEVNDKLTQESISIIAHTKPVKEEVNQLVEKAKAADDFMIRLLSEKYDVDFKRNQRLGNRVEVDAIGRRQHTMYFVEVKYMPTLSEARIREGAKRFVDRLSKVITPSPWTRLILAVAYDDGNPNDLTACKDYLHRAYPGLTLVVEKLNANS